MSSSHSISSVVPYIVASVAGREGGDAERIYGGKLTTAPAADEHVDIAYYFAVWQRALAALADPAFALRVAASFQLEDHEVFGFLAISCQTLGQAYERTARYRALYSLGARWELLLEPEATRLIWYPWPGDSASAGYRAAMDFAVADMADAIRRLAGVPAPLLAVRLVHPAPADATAFTTYYGVEPTFGAPLYELIYRPGLPDLPIATFNSRLRDYFDDACKRLVGNLASGTTLVDRVRKQLICAMDGGDTTIDTIAKQLGLSARSLQRHLAEEGTRYNDLLTNVREEFAKQYLARGTLSASEVAYLLGFTEPPAFFKAFKRWTGMTPREFQLGAAPA